MLVNGRESAVSLKDAAWLQLQSNERKEEF